MYSQQGCFTRQDKQSLLGRICYVVSQGKIQDASLTTRTGWVVKHHPPPYSNNRRSEDVSLPLLKHPKQERCFKPTIIGSFTWWLPEPGMFRPPRFWVTLREGKERPSIDSWAGKVASVAHTIHIDHYNKLTKTTKLPPPPFSFFSRAFVLVDNRYLRMILNLHQKKNNQLLLYLLARSVVELGPATLPPSGATTILRLTLVVLTILPLCSRSPGSHSETCEGFPGLAPWFGTYG